MTRFEFTTGSATFLVVIVAGFFSMTYVNRHFAETSKPPVVRNIGIAEQGDAIVVRERKSEPVPAATPVQK